MEINVYNASSCHIILYIHILIFTDMCICFSTYHRQNKIKTKNLCVSCLIPYFKLLHFCHVIKTHKETSKNL